MLIPLDRRLSTHSRRCAGQEPDIQPRLESFSYWITSSATLPQRLQIALYRVLCNLAGHAG